MKIFKQGKGSPIEPYGSNLYTKNPREMQKGKLYALGNGKKPKQNPINQEPRKYTVWVGGTEITDVFVKYSIAKELLKQYQALGYDDVYIQEGR